MDRPARRAPVGATAFVGITALVAAGLAGCGTGHGVAAPTTTVSPTTMVSPTTTLSTPPTSSRPVTTPSTVPVPATVPASSGLPPLRGARPGGTLLRTVLADATAERWLHATSTSPAATPEDAATTSVNADGPGRGTQEISLGSLSGDIRVLGARTYIEGAPEALVALFGLPTAIAGELGDRWITLRPGDSEYTTVTVGVTIRSFLSEIGFTGPVTAGTGTLGGAPTTVLEGRLSAQSGPGSGALYVSDAARPLPLLWEEIGSGVTTRTVLGGWGRPVPVAAPAGAVPLPAAAGGLAPVVAIRPD